MTNYELMKAAAFAGDTGGGGGGVENYLTSDIEVGTIDANGDNNDNENRLRTKDYTTLEAGEYTVFFTSELRVMWFRYAPDGTFIERSNSGYFADAPQTLEATEGQKFRFAFNTSTGTTPLEPSDLKNLVLLKN